MTRDTNPQVDQDRTADLVETFRKYGYLMFPQQKRIYQQIADRVAKRIVLEAGCGIGTGSAIIHERSEIADGLLATDKLAVNVRFAQELYPWIDFQTWDASLPLGERVRARAESVVAVEMVEHVADPTAVLRNLFDAATRELWVSTPNGRGKGRPPSNPFHVQEYTPVEMVVLLRAARMECSIDVLAWDTFEPVSLNTTDVDPLVYHVTW